MEYRVPVDTQIPFEFLNQIIVADAVETLKKTSR